MQNLTPRQIVAELDKYIVGQHDAKRAVAVAIRNRWRRQQLHPALAKDVWPKNIIMVGPTGVGKTEIARRIANLTGAPFIKVEATKFTEVGYHGRDVESMVRDLVEQAISIVRAEQSETVRDQAERGVEDRILEKLLPDSPASYSELADPTAAAEAAERRRLTRERMLEQLRAGAFEEREIELLIHQKMVSPVMFSNMGLDQMDPGMSKMFESLIPEQTQRKRLRIADARRILLQQETDKLIDEEKTIGEAVRRAEQAGIIFLDEIDKIAAPEGSGSGKGPDVSRQGVQRDLLPIVEGSTVTTRHGLVQTDHILFIAAGAFHSAAVSDLMPELQGRFPIRVELQPLTKQDFVRILTEPHNSLAKQQAALLDTEGLVITFVEGSIEAMADIAQQVNQRTENIGARRLMTIMEKLFDTINFEAPDMVARGETHVAITADLVRQRLAGIAADEDLSKFVL